MVSFKLRSRSRRHAQLIAVLSSVAVVAIVAAYAYAAPTARPRLRPPAPPAVTAVPRNSSAIILWKLPKSNGASKITGYRVTPYVGEVAQPHRIVGLVTRVQMTGLTNGQRYAFRVSAINSYGAGVARASEPITIGAPIAAPNYRRPTTTTTKPVTTTTKKPVYVPPPAPAPAPPAPAPAPPVGSTCVGKAMTRGQADIDASPAGTTYCLSGTHNWTLTPKSGDRLIGPAVLDGGKSRALAIEPGRSTNVLISGLEIRNYVPATQQGAIQPNQWATGWTLQNLQVHDNGTSAGGAGVNVGPGWKILGGRYYNNREQGLISALGHGAVVNGAEIDHNNFSNNAYTSRNNSCGNQAGGFKWIANNVTVTNSRVHDNACVGLWMDINSSGAVITNNQIYNNWDEGIFVEISHNVTITGNTVTGNGFKSFRAACANIWMYGGGITLAASDHVTVANNTVTGNCNGITATQESRPDGNPGLLQNISVHNNTVGGPGGKTGAAAWPVNLANLPTRNIAFTNNTITNGMRSCGLAC